MVYTDRFVSVGSRNPVKVEAVRMAFSSVWPDHRWRVRGFAVESRVSEQPMDETETILGATNRSEVLFCDEVAEFGVGIEGGLIRGPAGWMECAWVVVIDRLGREGIAASAKIMIPDQVYEMLEQGHTLNDACQRFFEFDNAGETIGYFGLMTNGAVDRRRAYVDAVAFALSRFAHPQLFE